MDNTPSKRVIVCVNVRKGEAPSCGGRGSLELADQLEKGIAERALPVTLKRIECLGECKDGPNVRIAPGGTFFHHCTHETIAEILDELAREPPPPG